MNKTVDYSVTLKDGSGKTLVVYINGASVDELVATGVSLERAKDDVEQDRFWAAIDRGDIAEDCWTV
jgi:hypothetical protein